MQQQRGVLVWLTGLSGAGKSSIAAETQRQLKAAGVAVQVIDADAVRPHLCGGLGFSRADREENNRRLAYVAGLFAAQGFVAVVAAVSPYRALRDAIRSQHPSFIEVFVDAPLQLCEERDPIGLYRRFHAGEVSSLSGLDSPYEAPLQPEVHCRTGEETVEQSAGKIVAAIEELRKSHAI